MKKHLYQLVRFGIVGASNTVIDIALYAALTRGSTFFGEWYLFAALISFVIAGLNGYFWNKHWTFKDGMHFSHKQLMAFYCVGGVTLGANLLLLWLFVSAGMNDVLAKLIAAVTAGIGNFLMQKFWIFPEKEL